VISIGNLSRKCTEPPAIFSLPSTYHRPVFEGQETQASKTPISDKDHHEREERELSERQAVDLSWCSSKEEEMVEYVSVLISDQICLWLDLDMDTFE
jgi:hypothetical protein